MASYRVFSGLLLALTLVNCHAAEVESSVSLGTTAETNDDGVELSSELNEDTTTETVGTVDDAVDDEVSTADKLESTADEIVNDEEIISEDDDEANEDDAETNASATASDEESESTGSQTVSINNSDSSVDQPINSVISIADGQYNLINITGKVIKDSIRFPGDIPTKTIITKDKAVIMPFIYTNSTNKLVLVEGHKCVERTYDEGVVQSERNLTTAECHQVIADMHRVERQSVVDAAKLRHDLDDAMAKAMAPLFGERPATPRHGGRRHKHRRHGHGNRLPNRLASGNAQAESSA